jgi:hypothetical protein
MENKEYQETIAAIYAIAPVLNTIQYSEDAGDLRQICINKLQELVNNL